MSLTLGEARERAALISNVSYEINLDLTDRERFWCRTSVRFDCTNPGAPTFLELTDAEHLKVSGASGWSYDGRRILLDGVFATNELWIEAQLPYVTDGDGMHTFTDPADGETYVSAYVGMDIAQRVFPCFDQNDLKAPVTLRVTAPDGWTVLANGRVAGQESGRWSFDRTPPIPPAMFVVCAGPWTSVAWQHDGLPFGWHARRSLTAELERDAVELQRITTTCFDRYRSIFLEPFAFDSYDQVMVPGQNWGALETPGCVTYRDELLPRGQVSEPERRQRAMIIAHEMAHMWFGDLVTMRWWEDTWLQESFADYMGYRLAEDAAGITGAFVDFTIGTKPGAYVADERRSTHPVAAVAEEVPDVDTAAGNFDSISYAKGNSAIRQLVTWLGDDAFLAGVNAYLFRHRLGNAELSDFVAALDGVSPRDVRGWAEVWLRTAGFDTIRVLRDSDGASLVREGTRPHRLRVTSYDKDLREVDSRLVDLADGPVRLPEAAVIVPNSHGETYARVRLDRTSWDAVGHRLSGIADDEVRALLWSIGFDLVHCGDLPAGEFLDLVTRHLPREPHAGIAHRVATWTRGTLVPRHLAPGEVTPAVAALAAACAAGLDSQPSPEVALVLTRHLAVNSGDDAQLKDWLAGGVTHTGIEVDPRLRWSALHRLAALGECSAEEIEDERRADGTIVGELGAATALAARPTPGAKAEAWAGMFEDPGVSNRRFEALAGGLWEPEQVTLVAPYVDRYLDQAPAVAAARGQAFSQVVGEAFPAIPVSDEQVAALERALTGDVQTVLRREWEDVLDDLRRARRTSR